MNDEHKIMSRRARRAHAEKQKRRARLPGLPFFLTLGILPVIAWILPLRPTVSAKEKRTLEAFPEFSLSAVTNGSYFSDISLWFSDTFPGRDGWIMAAQRLEALYGDSSVTVYGNASAGDKIPVPSTPAPETSADPAKPASEPTPTPEPTLTPEPVSYTHLASAPQAFTSTVFFARPTAKRVQPRARSVVSSRPSKSSFAMVLYRTMGPAMHWWKSAA